MYRMFSADAEVGVEAERLCQITGLRTRFAGRLAEHFNDAGSGFHDARQNLERRGLARAVRTDQPEDFSVPNFQIDAANCLNPSVVLP